MRKLYSVTFPNANIEAIVYGYDNPDDALAAAETALRPDAERWRDYIGTGSHAEVRLVSASTIWLRELDAPDSIEEF